ncbi:TetR/AcrR family transcriptional regulator [Nocardiopsis suaedae]|uniref:TetR family transcriptional regulator n=1 Tax=Nocardiopsis suaedae TaxID=3018444 RepID=A0ABT4TNC8_9ACTN|nr:TetR family transcriptional regulator [Nocardiopsis suaedae]MDA2806184.1 TetR family transcriptional regulator [Nocardiopsis suaedae]
MSARRREAVRAEIARAATALFAEKGVAGTTGEDIAAAIGISARTLWRYFPSKEGCVRPLLTSGLEAMAGWLRTWPPGTGLVAHLESRAASAGETLAAGPVTALIRMTRTEPGIRAVWMEVHREAEEVLAGILAERAGRPADDLAVRVHAAALNAALRLGAEEAAFSAGEDGYAACVREALRPLEEGLPLLRG